MVICDYGKGKRPHIPFPYFAEAMTGFEYSTAAHMLYANMEPQGIECIRNIRNRYDGEKRNPWDEAGMRPSLRESDGCVVGTACIEPLPLRRANRKRGGVARRRRDLRVSLLLVYADGVGQVLEFTPREARAFFARGRLWHTDLPFMHDLVRRRRIEGFIER